MRKNKYFYYLLSFILLLSSCANKNNGLNEYEKCLDVLNNEMNYTISVLSNGKTNTYEFSDGIIRVSNNNQDTYYYSENYKNYSLTYQKDTGEYIKTEIDTIEPYSLIGRFNTIYKYVESNCFVFKDGEYESSNIDDSYIYNDLVHKPLRIEMALSENRLFYFYEHYTVNSIEFTDVIYITDYGKTTIKLPN